MAEIIIVKKKPIWPWILIGLLALVIILYFLFFKDRMNDTTKDGQTMVNPRTNDNSEAVNDYVQYLNNDTAMMGLDHSFTHNALIKLIKAIRVTVDKKNIDLEADLNKATEDADKITDDPMATSHASYIKDAASRLSAALQKIQQAKFPHLSTESKKVTQAALEISKDDLTLDQKSSIHTFFNEAASLLKAMN